MTEERYVRVEVAVFARQMEATMQEHDPIKGDTWKYCQIGFLEHKLEEEIEEYKHGGRNPDELIDIANICMMLWNRRQK